MNQPRCQIPPLVGCAGMGKCPPAATYVQSAMGACPPQMGCTTCGGKKPLAGPGCGVGQVNEIVFGGGGGRGGGGRPGSFPRPFPFPVVRPIIQYPYYQQPIYVQPLAPAGCAGPVAPCPAGMAWMRRDDGYLCCVPVTSGRRSDIVMGPIIVVGAPGAGRCTTSAGCPSGYYCVSGRCALDVTSQVT